MKCIKFGVNFVIKNGVKSRVIFFQVNHCHMMLNLACNKQHFGMYNNCVEQQWLVFRVWPIHTSDIGNLGAKLNIKKIGSISAPIPMLEKINVKACNVVFTLITLKQHSFIVQTHI